MRKIILVLIALLLCSLFLNLHTPSVRADVIVVRELSVNGFVSEYTAWTETGASPWLDVADGDTNKIDCQLSSQVESYFTIANLGANVTSLITVEPKAVVKSDSATDYARSNLYIWNGSSWILFATLNVVGTSYTTIIILDIKSILDTPTKVNNACLRLITTPTNYRQFFITYFSLIVTCWESISGVSVTLNTKWWMTLYSIAEVWIWDGSAYVAAGTVTDSPSGVWGWRNFSVTSILNSEAKINNARLRLRGYVNVYGDILCTYAELKVVRSIGGVSHTDILVPDGFVSELTQWHFFGSPSPYLNTNDAFGSYCYCNGIAVYEIQSYWTYQNLPSWQPPTATISSDPEINAPFQVNSVEYSTPTSLYFNYSTYQFTAEPEHTYGDILYTFSHWTVNSTTYSTLSIYITFTSSSLTNITIFYDAHTTPSPPPLPPTSGTGINATWYMRSDTWTVHGTLGYKLSPVNSYTPTHDNRYTYLTVGSSSYGVRVWMVGYAGDTRELTSGTPVAVATRSVNGSGIQSATWSCPQTDNIISAIIVRVYHRFNSGTWTLRRIFTTTSKLWIKLPASTWTFYYYTQAGFSSGNSTFHHGSMSYPSRVTLTYILAYPFEVQSISLYHQDLLGFIFMPWTYYLGESFWGILLLFGCVTMYLRFHSLRAVVGVLYVFGGVGGLLSAFIPSIGFHLAWLVLAIALAITLFKAIR